MSTKRFRVVVTMSQQTARRVSWSIAVLSFMVVMIGLVISIHALIASEQGVTFSHQFFTPLLTITYCVVGALVASRHPRNPIGWMFCATGFLSAFNMLSSGYALYSELALKSDSLPGVMFARWLTFWIWIPNILLPVTFPLLLFPDGKLLSARWHPIVWAAGFGLLGVTGSMAFHPGPLENMGFNGSNPYGISGGETVISALLTLAVPLLLIGVFGSIASIIVRFRRAVGIERAQLKWLVVAGVVVIVGNILGGILWWLWGDNPITQELSIVITDITIVNIVIATGIAILRYRLWDIHILVNRTLVYGALTALVISTYVVIVGVLGTLLQTGGSLPVSLLGTGIVAVSFQPLRERLQRGVNRLMYGERDSPYAILGRLSERLEVVVASQSVLPTIVETVADAFKLPYAAVALKEGEQFIVAAEYTRPSMFARTTEGGREILPLVYQLETIGQLILAPRAPGESFSQTDRRLLETIARQAGVAAYNVRLTQDLQRSRERLVTTREEERRRLRRDLHDGLGPVLAAMSFKLDAVHNLADRDADAVKKMSTELKAQMQEVLADIRRIAYDLRPPALDELGLVGALKAHIASHNQVQGLQITLEAPENPPPLPAAVEVAAYRIALEAMTNVSRHAGARHCCVRLSLPDGLCLEVTDDGRGLPNRVQAGVGLTSMRERAEELGGMCIAEALPTGGTGVTARLPLSSVFAAIAEGYQWNLSGS
ncbi:MAG: GAF domain-containing sensor histidine kinase [Anaerolineae bacterium]|nr:GAF domain-containing sensor histidine kinase [Anaerolineae bacterium]